MKSYKLVLYIKIIALLFLGACGLDSDIQVVETKLIDVSSCSGAPGALSPLPGNVSTPVAVFDPGHKYVTWLSNDHLYNVVVTHVKYGGCTPAIRVNVAQAHGGSRSHDAPSVHVDGAGYIYSTYFGRSIYTKDGSKAASPFIRKTKKPNDVSSWGPEERTRLWTFAELHSQRLLDGGLLLAGSDLSAVIDIIQPAGGASVSYRWESARQVITQDTSSSGSPPGCSFPYLNRFTKAVFSQGVDGRLYVVWGWGGGYYDHERPALLCNDIRHYTEDSHELYFAYSEDGGMNWRNKAGTKSIMAFPCSSRSMCYSNTRAGIVHNDPAYRLTTTRQGEHRKIWVHEDGTVYIVFVNSSWCDSGVCNQVKSTAKHPGALKLLKFKLGKTPITETTVHANQHFNIGGIRKHKDDLYIWAHDKEKNRIYEYLSVDNGKSWKPRKLVMNKTCWRLHGSTDNSFLLSVQMVFACNFSKSERSIYYYERSLDTKNSNGTLRRPTAGAMNGMKGS